MKKLLIILSILFLTASCGDKTDVGGNDASFIYTEYNLLPYLGDQSGVFLYEVTDANGCVPMYYDRGNGSYERVSCSFDNVRNSNVVRANIREDTGLQTYTRRQED